MRRTLFTLNCILFSVLSFAQPTIKGSVKDQTSKPVQGANISILDQQFKIIKFAVSDSLGLYEVKGIRPGVYILSFKMLGFDSVVSTPVQVTDNNETRYDVVMTTLSKNLDDVAVTSKKLFVETRTDRIIINPDALISTGGSNALDVLDKSPGIMVDENGSITLKGRSVVVFIDDKPTYMSGMQLLEFLRGQSAGTIDKIEIMSNPPAKYDAAGGGVINIRTKKSKTRGYNANLNLSYTQGVYSRSNNSINLNYRNNKLNVFGSFSHVLNNGFNDLTIDRDYTTNSGLPDYAFEQKTFIRTTSNSYNTKLGADYYITKRTTAGLVLNANSRHFNNRTTNTSYIIDAPGTTDSIITADNRDKGSWTNNSINLNLRHDFKKPGNNLAIDVDHLVYNYGNDQLFINNSYFGNGTAKSNNALSGHLPAEIRITSGKADYMQTLEDGLVVSTGIKNSYTETDNLASYAFAQSGIFTPDYTRSNHFLYKENIGAGYLSLSKEMKRWSFQAGVRVEHTTSKGHQLGNPQKSDSSFNRKYTNTFPTLYLSYKIDKDEKHKLNLSYGKRIDRPVYQDLNPFISPLDQFTNYVGNPLLTPVFNNNVEVAYVFNNRITATLSHYRIKDIIQESIEIYGNNYYSKPANIGKADITALALNGMQQIAKPWNLNFYADVQRRHYTGELYTGKLDTAAWFSSVNITNQFNLKNGWSFELSGFYRTNILVGQIVSGEFWQMNAGVQKKVLKNKGTIRLNVRDIFYTRLNWGYINNLQNATASYHNEYDTRMATLSFTYNFGKLTSSRPRKTGGVDDEQNRIRS